LREISISLTCDIKESKSELQELAKSRFDLSRRIEERSRPLIVQGGDSQSANSRTQNREVLERLAHGHSKGSHRGRGIEGLACARLLSRFRESGEWE
jgi:hypothetical protein